MKSFADHIINGKKIVLVLGAGGVGKTTNSIALALAAAKSGKKVALLSIDPAKRLAAALGIELSGELKKINLADAHLEACMLDQKNVFDEMVRKFVHSPKALEKIFSNSIYQAASTKFGGVLEYMALAKLQRLIDEDRYDYIVLDTPPDTHALDFLSKPNALAGFMDTRVMKWLIKPFYFAQKFGLGRLMSAGEKLAGGIAEVTGVKALQILAEFLVLMQDVIEGFHETGKKVAQSLRREDTGFVIVSTLRSSSLRSAKFLAAELKKQVFRLDGLLINRVLAESSDLDSVDCKGRPILSRRLEIYQNSYRSQKNLLERLPRDFPDLACSVLTLPEYQGELLSTDAMTKFAANIR